MQQSWLQRVRAALRDDNADAARAALMTVHDPRIPLQPAKIGKYLIACAARGRWCT
jgi:hypothetical protein